MTQGDSVEIVIERVFDAPRELIWKLWTDPEHVGQRWGPRGMKTRVDELDLRPPGGNWRYVMVGPDGSEMPQWGTFREIVAPERIVMSAVFETGGDATTEVILAYLFDDLGDKTKVTMRITHPSAEARRQHEQMGVVQGWNANFDSLDDHLARLVALSNRGVIGWAAVLTAPAVDHTGMGGESRCAR